MFKKNSQKISPEWDDSRQISVNECLRLKEDTRNRLKNKPPNPSREMSLDQIVHSYEESTRPLYAKLPKATTCPEVVQKKPEKRKKSPDGRNRKPPSTSLSSQCMDDAKKRMIPADPPPRISEAAVKDLARRQNAWLKSLADRSRADDEPSQCTDFDAGCLQMPVVNTANSWNRAKQLSIKRAERDKERLRSRQESQRILEERRLMKTEQQLLELSKFDAAVYTPLKRVQRKLERLRNGEDTYDDADNLPVRPHTAGAALGRREGDDGRQRRSRSPPYTERYRSSSPCSQRSADNHPIKSPQLPSERVANESSSSTKGTESSVVPNDHRESPLSRCSPLRSAPSPGVRSGRQQDDRSPGRLVVQFSTDSEDGDENISEEWQKNIDNYGTASTARCNGDSSADGGGVAQAKNISDFSGGNSAVVAGSAVEGSQDMQSCHTERDSEGGDGGMVGGDKERVGNEDDAFADEMLLFMRRKVPSRQQEEDDDYESDIPVPLLDQDGNLVSSEYRDRVMVSPLSDVGDTTGGPMDHTEQRGDEDLEEGADLTRDMETTAGTTSYAPTNAAYMSVQSLPPVDIVKFLTRQNVTILSRAVTVDASGGGSDKYSHGKFKRSASDGGGYLQAIDEGDGGSRMGSPRSIHTYDDDDDDLCDDDSIY